MSSPSPELRRQVIAIYKELLYLGREYPHPEGFRYFRPRLHAAFAANAHLRDDDAVRRAVARAHYIKREIEALYYLKRYRTLRKRYSEA
ncbi:hypothetical protein GGS23DRAFT_558972 [Durotheca rogersii]|uniref:uncharacterized protein n=1 Tax=Durotheca rogersii TaxID=419775 RepID=UPI00221F7C27|nr:uncharacterized protein GGS23DRAFT_558972 [Durotheca rogersii]KAI5865381.1 hypothetical protein GGS23DRAFT_558972 [Durotheca rogersii]